MIRRPPRSTPLYSSAASDVYKRQPLYETVQQCNKDNDYRLAYNKACTIQLFRERILVSSSAITDRQAYYQVKRLISRNIFQLTSNDFKASLPSIIPTKTLYTKRVPAKYMQSSGQSTCKPLRARSVREQTSGLRAKQGKLKYFFRPTNNTGAIRLINRDEYMDESNTIETFLNKNNKEQLNVLKKYSQYAAIIHRQYLLKIARGKH
eukprot:TRINITY_DN7826_c0_g2_i9.p1 TRINITY_DN7826_c0_g2~~TRINITY_DN7826_c0_g2_i9.p1  ORF type:complete len:218 (+),score=26.68 TRINITY_DN7826_c0_g2_i9:36-656(+)